MYLPSHIRIRPDDVGKIALGLKEGIFHRVSRSQRDRDKADRLTKISLQLFSPRLSEIPDTHPIEEEPGGKQQKEHKEPLIKEIVDDRDEEKRLESADDPSPHIRRACAVVGTVRSQHIFCSRPDIRLLPAFRFLCVFSTVSPLAASDYTFPEQYLRLLPFPCDLLHTLFLRIRFNGMIFQTSLYAVFTKHHGPR